ncbi:MAG: GAF domain-containing protein, partial [Chloroflexi bacterium]|nr:GAF domain-containing protein [Chloroflexota bacterium]
MNLLSNIKPGVPYDPISDRLVPSLAFALVCALGCFLLVKFLGESALIATSLPVVLIAAKYGKWLGLAGALTAIAFNSLLVFTVLDSTWFEWFKSGGAFGHLALIGVALLVGWLQEALQKFSDSEKALKVANLGNLRLAEDSEELAAIGRLVGSSLDLGDIYPEFAKHAGELISFDWIGIHIIDTETQRLELSYISGFGAEDFETQRDISADKTFGSEVVGSNGVIVNEQGGQTISQRFPGMQNRLQDIADSIEERRLEKSNVSANGKSLERPVEQLRSLLGVPLSEGADNFGALVFASNFPNAYFAKDMDMANRVAHQISGAISKSRLFAEKTRAEEIQFRNAEQLETLFKVSKILARRDTVESKAKKVLEIVVPLVDAATASIRILDNKSDSLKLIATDGPDARGLTTFIRLSDKGMSQRAFKSGKSALATHYAKEPGARINLLVNGIQSMYSIPLFGASGPVGILNITGKSHDHFSQERQDLLEAIADEMASQFDSEFLSVDLEASQKEISVVNEMARIMSSTLDLDQVYKQFFDELKTIIRFDLAGVISINEESGMFDIVFLSDPNLASFRIGDSFQFSGTIPGYMIGDVRTFIIDDLSQPLDLFASTRIHQLFEYDGFRSMIQTPMISDERMIGAFTLFSRQKNRFGQRERVIVERLANQVAPAIENADLYHQLQATSAEIAVVDEVSRIITSTLDVEHVYKRFFDELKTIVQFDLANVILLNEESGLIDVAFVSDPDRSSYQKGDSIELAGTIFSHVIEEGRAVIIDDLTQPNEYRPLQKNDGNIILSLIQTPLICEEKVIGGFNLFSWQKNSFRQRERVIVERLASQIAPAVRNSLAYRREEQLAIALDSIGEAVAFLDSDMVYRHVNRAFEELYGYSEEEIRGQPIAVIPMRDPGKEAQTHEIMERGFTSGWSGEVVRRTKSGELLDILLTVAPVKDASGHVTGRISVSRDITERKKTEARLNEASRIASVGELAAGVAHEINNPLTSILLCSEFLAGSNLPEEALADLKTISDSAQRAAKIVQNLLLFARRKDTEPAVLRMSSILERALELKSFDFKIKSIKVHLDFAHDAPYSLIDEHQMTQVIVNVLNNAEQSLTASGRGGNIWIKISVEEGHVLTAVSDDGPGISADVLQKIFEPFFTTKAAGHGTGLGLSICYGIVQQHGGEMWAESKFNDKTTFYVRIPVAEEQLAVLPSGEQPMA